MALKIIEEYENRSAPNKTGIYPPISEPIVMPVKTKNFLDIINNTRTQYFAADQGFEPQ